MNEQLGSDIKPSKLPHSGHGPTYYEILDVSSSASRLQIREAYIRLRNTYSSGSQALYSLVSEEEARESLDRIEEAYRILDDESQRREYDQLIGLTRESSRTQGSEYFTGTLDGASARRTLHSPATDFTGEFDDASLMAAEVWVDESGESSRAAARRALTLGKIKKAASRSTDPDVQTSIQAIMSRSESFDGKGLAQLRDIVGVPQSEVQERTKISIEYIKALENNDFQKLPSLVYVRGFLKIYLQYLGLADAVVLIEAYTGKYNHWRETTRPHSS